MDLLPPYCSTGQGLWRVRCPLICFEVVEWHYADRVLRQFDIRQFIPQAPENSIRLHSITGHSQQNWEVKHQYYIVLWVTRHTLVIGGDDTLDRPECDPDYMDWYRSVTRRQILNPKLAQQTEGEFEGTHGATTYLAESLSRVYHRLRGASTYQNISDSVLGRITDAISICDNTLTNVGQSHLLDHEPAVPPSSLPRSRGRGSRGTQASSRPVYTEHIHGRDAPRGSQDIPSISQPRDIPSTSTPCDIPSTSRTLVDDVNTDYMNYDPSQFCTPQNLIITQPFHSPFTSSGGVPSMFQAFPSGQTFSSFQTSAPMQTFSSFQSAVPMQTFSSFQSAVPMQTFSSLQSSAPMQDEPTLPTPPAAQPTETPSPYIRRPRRGPPREARDKGRPCGTHDRLHR